MNFKKLSLVVAAMGFSAWAGACYSQPPPPCPVATGNPLGVPPGNSPLGDSAVQFALPNFWAGYSLQSGDKMSVCGSLGGEEIGTQRFEAPGKSELTVALRSFRMGYKRGNAAGYGALDYADDAVDEDTGEIISDYVTRVDPTDPDGKKMAAIGKMTSFPNASNLCEVSDVSAADQTFQEEVITLVDGGTSSGTVVDDGGVAVAVFPQLHMKYEWTNVKFLATTEVPGQVFTADLKVTEDTCTATYKVQGLWPITLCHTDLDCSPYALPDAGDNEISIAGRRFQGSGLNPALANDAHPFHCNTAQAVLDYTSIYGVGDDWGVCEMTRPISDFTGGK